MKKVLFYYPKTSGEEDSSSLYLGLPLSILSLVAQLDENDFHIKVLDGRIQDNDIDESVNWICSSDMNCICISAMTSYQIRDGLDLAKRIRDINSNVKIIWGGWHASLVPEQTIKHPLVDIIAIGQSEMIIKQLLSNSHDEKALSEIPNLFLKSRSGDTYSTSFEFLTDYHATHTINKAYTYINVEQYIQNLWGHKRVIGYESSRGCPWNCRFCSIGSVYNRRWNALPANRVSQEIQELRLNYDIDAIHFYDNNFFVNKKRAMEISESFLRNDLKIHWDGTATVEQFLNLPDEYILRLKQSGFFRIIVGVESGDEEVLSLLNKKHRNNQVIEMIEKCVRLNILPSLSFMVGFPINPENDLMETIGLIEKIKRIEPLAEILLFIFTPYLGTPMYDVALEHGMKYPSSLEGWANYTYEKVNVPWIDKKMKRKIDRYISFFGTKDMNKEVLSFYRMES